MRLRTSLHCGNRMAAKHAPKDPAANRDLMVETTMLPTRTRPPGAAPSGAPPAGTFGQGLPAHPSASASQSDGIRAGLANFWAVLAALAKDFSTPMLSLVIAHVVALCTRRVWPVIV